MRKLYAIEDLNFFVYDVSITVIYNNEIVKNRIIRNFREHNFFIIDSKDIISNKSVSEYLKANKFNMKMVPYFNLEKIISRKLKNLSYRERIYLKTIILITTIKLTYIFDDILTFLNEDEKNIIIKYLKDNNLNFLNITSDIDEVLFTNYLIVLTKGGVAIEGNTKNVLKEEKLLKKLGFSLPFTYDLSLQLMSYGLLDKPYYSVDRLVNNLWK